jgi:hypothetical protein
MYMPEIGRWGVVDPMAPMSADWTLYRFCFNNPLRFVDPTGMYESVSEMISDAWNKTADDTNRGFDYEEGTTKEREAIVDIFVVAENKNKSDGKPDDAIVDLHKSASGVSGMIVLEVKGLTDLTNKLKQLNKASGLRIRNFYFASHGNYEDPNFRIGSDLINATNVQNLKVLSEFVSPQTRVLLLSCHSGGGLYPELAGEFIQTISNIFNTEVYANRSWGRGTVFDGKVDAYDDIRYIKTMLWKKNAIEFMGQWLKATPNGTPQTINAIYTLPDGNFGIPPKPIGMPRIP